MEPFASPSSLLRRSVAAAAPVASRSAAAPAAHARHAPSAQAAAPAVRAASARTVARRSKMALPEPPSPSYLPSVLDATEGNVLRSAFLSFNCERLQKKEDLYQGVFELGTRLLFYGVFGSFIIFSVLIIFGSRLPRVVAYVFWPIACALLFAALAGFILTTSVPADELDIDTWLNKKQSLKGALRLTLGIVCIIGGVMGCTCVFPYVSALPLLVYGFWILRELSGDERRALFRCLTTRGSNDGDSEASALASEAAASRSRSSCQTIPATVAPLSPPQGDRCIMFAKLLTAAAPTEMTTAFAFTWSAIFFVYTFFNLSALLPLTFPSLLSQPTLAVFPTSISVALLVNHVIPMVACLTCSVYAAALWVTASLANPLPSGWRTATLYAILVAAALTIGVCSIFYATTNFSFFIDATLGQDPLLSALFLPCAILVLFIAGLWPTLGGREWAFLMSARGFEKTNVLKDGAMLAALVVQAPTVDHATQSRWVLRSQRIPRGSSTPSDGKTIDRNFWVLGHIVRHDADTLFLRVNRSEDEDMGWSASFAKDKLFFRREGGGTAAAFFAAQSLAGSNLCVPDKASFAAWRERSFDTSQKFNAADVDKSKAGVYVEDENEGNKHESVILRVKLKLPSDASKEPEALKSDGIKALRSYSWPGDYFAERRLLHVSPRDVGKPEVVPRGEVVKLVVSMISDSKFVGTDETKFEFGARVKVHDGSVEVDIKSASESDSVLVDFLATHGSSDKFVVKQLRLVASGNWEVVCDVDAKSIIYDLSRTVSIEDGPSPPSPATTPTAVVDSEGATSISVSTPSSSALRHSHTPLDFFISHSWGEGEALLKNEALSSFFNDRRAAVSKSCMWLDKVCLNTGSKANTDGISLFPVTVGMCKRMLVVLSPSYLNRIWCVWELYAVFAFCIKELAADRVIIVDAGGGDQLKENALKWSLDDAHCFDPNEELKLRRLFCIIGEEKFRESVLLLSRCKMVRPAGVSSG